MDELSAIAARIVGRDGHAGPWTLEVYPTLRCNLDCAFCDTTERHRPPQNELPPARWLAIVDEAADLGARHVMVLGGGEPTLAAATLPLMERAKARGLTGMLTTNGTRCPPETQARWIAMGWDEVHVSLDGADAATHDGLRGRGGTFRRVVSSVCQLRRRRDAAGAVLPRIALHTVVTRRNVGQLPAIVRLAAALGAFRVEFDALSVYRPEQRALELRLGDRPALLAAVREGEAEAARLGVSTTLDRLVVKDAILRGERDVARDVPAATGPAAAPCLRAWHHLVIQADGRTAPCCVLTGEGESVAAAPVAAVWGDGGYFASVRAGMLRGQPTPGCAWCSENILAHERAIRARIPA